MGILLLLFSVLQLYQTRETASLLPVLATMLQFSPAELERCQEVGTQLEMPRGGLNPRSSTCLGFRGVNLIRKLELQGTILENRWNMHTHESWTNMARREDQANSQNSKFQFG